MMTKRMMTPAQTTRAIELLRIIVKPDDLTATDAVRIATDRAMCYAIGEAQRLFGFAEPPKPAKKQKRQHKHKPRYYEIRKP
jgi:hypothetical protein